MLSWVGRLDPVLELPWGMGGYLDPQQLSTQMLHNNEVKLLGHRQEGVEIGDDFIFVPC